VILATCVESEAVHEAFVGLCKKQPWATTADTKTTNEGRSDAATNRKKVLKDSLNDEMRNAYQCNVEVDPKYKPSNLFKSFSDSAVTVQAPGQNTFSGSTWRYASTDFGGKTRIAVGPCLLLKLPEVSRLAGKETTSKSKYGIDYVYAGLPPKEGEAFVRACNVIGKKKARPVMKSQVWNGVATTRMTITDAEGKAMEEFSFLEFRVDIADQCKVHLGLEHVIEDLAGTLQQSSLWGILHMEVRWTCEIRSEHTKHDGVRIDQDVSSKDSLGEYLRNKIRMHAFEVCDISSAAGVPFTEEPELVNIGVSQAAQNMFSGGVGGGDDQWVFE